jgi:hypothetical protein
MAAQVGVAPAPPAPSGAAQTRAAWDANVVAAPTWASPSSQRAPQIMPSAVADTPSRSVGDLAGATLRCELEMRRARGWDTFKGKADLDVRFVVGKDDTAGVTLVGPRDSGRVRFSVPGVWLHKGEKVKLSAADRDYDGYDWIGAVLLPFDGRLPLRFVHRYFIARCDLAPPADTTAAHAKRIDATFDALERELVPDPKDARFGYPRREDLKVRRAIEVAAGHYGWSDGRVVALRDRYLAALALWEERAAAEVSALVGKAVDTAPPRHVDMTLGGAHVSCSSKAALQFPAILNGAARPCVLRAHLDVSKRAVLQPSGLRGDIVARRVSVLTTGGRVVGVGVGRYRLDGTDGDYRPRLRVRRNDGATAVWALPLIAGERPALLRVEVNKGRKTHYVWVRLWGEDERPPSGGA